MHIAYSCLELHWRFYEFIYVLIKSILRIFSLPSMGSRHSATTSPVNRGTQTLWFEADYF